MQMHGVFFCLLTVIGMLETRIHAECPAGYSGAVLHKTKHNGLLQLKNIVFLFFVVFLCSVILCFCLQFG